MKPSRLFWGVLFLTLGGLLLLDRLTILTLDRGVVWRFWPVILITWGISALVGNRAVKSVLVVLSAAGIGILAASALSFPWMSHQGPEYPEAYEQVLTEPYDAGIHQATLTVDGSAGKYVVNDTTHDLIAASTHSSVGQYSMERSRADDAEYIKITSSGQHRIWRTGMDNSAHISLNPGPVWRIDMHIGAAGLDADLSPYKTESVNIEAGAASVRVKFGAHLGETRARIRAGVSSITVSVPDTAGCEVRLEGGLSTKNMKGFQKLNEHTYRTVQFDDAAAKIFLTVEAGLSSITVKRY